MWTVLSVVNGVGMILKLGLAHTLDQVKHFVTVFVKNWMS